MRVPGSQRLGLGATQIGGTNLSPTPVDAVPGAMPGNGGKNGSGSGFLGLADTIEVFDKARRENEAQKGSVEFLSGVRELRTTVEQAPEADPVAPLNKYDEGVQSLRDSITERYKNDEHILSKVLPKFENFASEQRQHVRNLTFKRTVEQGRVDGEQNDEVLLSTLRQGSSLRDVEWARSLNEEDVESKRISGIYGAVEAYERKKKFNDKATERAKELNFDDAYAKIYNQFKDNSHGAVEFLRDPKNRAALGLSYGEANDLLANMDQQAARDKRRADEARTAGERSEKELYYRALEKSDLEGAAAILAKARNIPGAERMQMRQAITKDQWNDDPKVASEVQRKVWMGEIKDVSQLTPLVGNGLSVKTARTLREDIDKLNKDAPDFQGAMNFYSNALRRYNTIFKDTHLADQEGVFAATLAYQAKQQNIGPFDARMNTLADELLKVTDTSWVPFTKDRTTFERQFEEKTLPGVPKPGQAAPVPAKTANPAMQIPRDQYDAVKQALANAGKDTSDETVLSVWKANRDKLKGAK